MIELPDTITSMKALTSHGSPMFGSTLDSGVISAPASAPSPAPSAKVVKRIRSALMPRPRARSSFMMTARVRTPKRVPFSSSVSATYSSSAPGTRNSR